MWIEWGHREQTGAIDGVGLESNYTHTHPHTHPPTHPQNLLILKTDLDCRLGPPGAMATAPTAAAAAGPRHPANPSYRSLAACSYMYVSVDRFIPVSGVDSSINSHAPIERHSLPRSNPTIDLHLQSTRLCSECEYHGVVCVSHQRAIRWHDVEPRCCPESTERIRGR